MKALSAGAKQLASQMPLSATEQLVVDERLPLEKAFLLKLKHLESLMPEERPELVSSATGKIDKVLMSYNLGGGGADEYNYAEKLEELMDKLPDTQFVLFGVDPRTNKRLVAKTREKFLDIDNRKSESDKLMVIHATDFSDFGIWMQDPFLVFKDKESLYLTEPLNFKGSPLEEVGEEKIAEIVAERLTAEEAFGMKVKQCKVPFYFEGGNILADDNFILIGKDHYQPHRELLNQVDNFLLRIVAKLSQGRAGVCFNNVDRKCLIMHLLQRAFGPDKTVIILGNGFPRAYYKQKIKIWSDERMNVFSTQTQFQPLAHIDLFMTLAGKDKEGRYVILIADPELPQFEQDENLRVDFLLPIKSKLDEIELLLQNKTYISKNGEETFFRIVRNRMPFVSRDLNGGTREWYPLYYNNCLVEVTDKSRKVWYPTYLPVAGQDWPFLESYNEYYEKLWKETLAFDEVYPLSNYFNLAKAKGALHCIVKVLNRI